MAAEAELARLLKRAADRAGKVAVTAEVTRVTSAPSSETRPPAPPVLSVRLGAGIRLEQAGADAGAGDDASARGVDAQPGVLRAAADARLRLQHPAVPALLPGDHRRRPDPATRHARHRRLLIVADECHHVPAAAFEDAVRQIRARRWLGLTVTPYRRDKLETFIWADFRACRAG